MTKQVNNAAAPATGKVRNRYWLGTLSGLLSLILFSVTLTVLTPISGPISLAYSCEFPPVDEPDGDGD